MLGFGLGLRSKHFNDVITDPPKVDWFEVITENFIRPGGNPRRVLDEVRKNFPIVFHGVTLGIGSTDPIDHKYLDQIKSLIERYEPPWISDHLCWTGVQGKLSHDLLPVSYSENSLNHITERIDRVQSYLGRELVLENPSSYILFKSSVIPEWEFLSELVKRTGCKLLLDVNNVFVSSFNHGWNSTEYIESIPLDSVQQIHLAGHSHRGDHIVDTHDDQIVSDVWDLYRLTCERFGPVPTMIERDDEIPELPKLVEELDLAREIWKSIDAPSASGLKRERQSKREVNVSAS